MRKIIFIPFMIFFVNTFSQEVKVSGLIKDNTGLPLEYANVVAINSVTRKLASYSVTNNIGKYQFSLKYNANYILKVSFIGYKTISETIEVTESSIDFEKNFILNKDDSQLDEVVISYEMPVSVKGDTIVYNADSFKNGTEKKLGDVLKKLPGVEINDDGEIEVEGNRVQKVMIEGKDFFDGDSKLAVENIPSSAIEKVEVLKNYNEISQLKGVMNDEDSMAINIKLKEGKKNFWFGDITAGGGPDERYLVHPKLFYYSPKNSINIITDINNIGEIPFTRRDYFKFSGGFKNLEGTGTALNLTSDNLGFSLLQNNMANEIETKFGAVNFSYAPSESLDISGFFIYSGSKNDIEEITTRDYILDNLTEETTTSSVQDNNLGLGKISASYKPHNNFQLDYDVFFKGSEQKESSSVLSMTAITNNSINELKEDTPFSINQNANLYYTLNDGHIFSAEVQHLWSKETPFYNATLLGLGENPSVVVLPFSTVFPYDTAQEDYGIHQDKTINTHKLDAKVNYYNVLNKTSNLNFFIGGTNSKQHFDSSIFQTLDDGSINDFSEDTFSNDVTANFLDIYVGAKYKFVTGKFTFAPGVTLHNYTYTNQQLEEKQEDRQTKLLPNFYTNLQFKKSESLRFNYSKTVEYPDVNSVAQGYVFNNYNSLFQGNNEIKNGLYDSFSLNYRSFSLFNYTNVLASLRYKKMNNPIKNSLSYQGINSVSTPINSIVTDESLNGIFRWDKTMGKYKVNLNANVSWLNNFNLVNGEITESESLTQRYKASVLTNFKKGPNFEVGYQRAISDFTNSGTKNTFYTDNPFAKLEMVFFTNFSFTSDYSFYNYSDDHQTLNSYSFLNANLYYGKKDSKWEYRAGVKNIFNTQSINQNKYNEAFSTTSEYFVQPRYGFLTVTYNL
ncbi:CarboxypepD_reg-like domain-containing protein [Tenacibaculum sp. MAR_2009_124]|uniref:carboxypeptidase-like regulatory domain-containing protein n=1 Tax=Tenacibaculum sp. MAR_2009_124 TaxID=1250059 RepID=UPI000898625D|nr:carboxypeptidase-like regulatory domain-containing protein [Tenacibaculum sp. MAR_2009_124]SEB45766.1 CarboxypepD_reg-like domain-containing protein [Tenacibaculum sp. MAR_2009_124]